MSTLQIELTDEQFRRLAALATDRRTTPEQLAREAVEKFAADGGSAGGPEAADADAEEHRKFLLWREALLGVEGMWKDRTDLPDFEDVRRSLDRDLWSK